VIGEPIEARYQSAEQLSLADAQRGQHSGFTRGFDVSNPFCFLSARNEQARIKSKIQSLFQCGAPVETI
jgi:hypothetical protein